MKQEFLAEPSVTIMVAKGDIPKSRPYETEIQVPEGATHAIVLAERLSGSGSITVSLEGLTTEEREELSRLRKVQLRFIRLASNTESLAVKVATSAKALVRVTVAFVKRETASLRKNFSCRACKQLCRLAISALLAHLGIPYLDAEATIDMPDVLPPNESTHPQGGWKSVGDLLKSSEGNSTVPVQVGEPVSVGDKCRAWLGEPSTAPSWVREMFDLIHPQAIAAVRGALELVDWVFDATDRLYTAACEKIGMCKPEASAA